MNKKDPVNTQQSVKGVVMNPTQKSGCPIEQLGLTHPDWLYYIRVKKPLENPVLEVLPKVCVAASFSFLGLTAARKGNLVYSTTH
ncbi:hypothetical protein BJP36_39990 [Moorena producens JHB]|uniref:Uncharacterized protein n=2 Tax=Moorena TaxID=1155738 RepID=A0A9Q9SRX8_MOOP1|nr:hypothetical protein [Moorena producens]WAN68559.1 hypothetical protein BJP36_39990 [Moorena producens JHB]